METKTIIAIAIGALVFMFVVGVIAVSGIKSQKIIQEKMLSCIQGGTSALECKCAIRYCN